MRHLLTDARITLRFLRGSYAQLALSVIAVACGVAQVCTTDLVSQGARRAFVDVIDNMAGRAALQVTAGDDADLPEQVVDLVAAVDGVEAATAAIHAEAFTPDGSGELLTVRGVDLASDVATRIYELSSPNGHDLDDPKILLPSSIIITESLANRRGLKKGDPFRLETRSGVQTYTVRGLLAAKGAAVVYGGNLVVIDLYGAQEAFAHPGFVNSIDIVVANSRQVDEVRDRIAAALPPGLKIESPSQRKADLHRIMMSFATLLRAISGVGLVAAFMIAFNRLATVFEQRSWQLGVLNATGVPIGVIWRLLLYECVLLGAVGVALGIPSGIAFAQWVQPLITRSAALAYNLVTPASEPAVRLSSVLLAAAAGGIAALLAGALPAWRAAQLGSARTMRSRGTEQPEQRPVLLTVARIFFLLAILLTAVLQWATQAAAWGLLATAVAAFAAAFWARPLIERFASVSVHTFHWLGMPSVAMAANQIRQNTRRSALLIATLGVSIGAVIWLCVVSRSLANSVTASITDAGVLQSDLVVGSSRVAQGVNEVPVTERLVDELRKLPGVRDANSQFVVFRDYNGVKIGFETFDPGVFLTMEGVTRDLPDWPAKLASGEGALVSSSFVRNFGLARGDTLTLDSPTGPVKFLICGEFAGFSSPQGTVRFSRAIYAERWNRHEVTRVFVKGDDTQDVRALQTTIANSLGRKYGLRILFARDLAEYFAQQVNRAFAGLHILTAIVLVVAFAGIADSLAAAVIERTRILGAFRALGVHPGALFRMMVGEAMLHAVCGILLALIMGIGLGLLWVEQTFPLLIGWNLEFHLPLTEIITIIGLALLICVVAALLPARSAAKIVPAEALRYE